MTLVFDIRTRESDSPLVESVMHGHTVANADVLRPAESRWHMVLVRHAGQTVLRLVGPWDSSALLKIEPGVELLWIRFKLGAYMSCMPTARFAGVELALPGASSSAFWLNGSAWTFPDFENADTFVSKLARTGILTSDTLVAATLQGRPIDAAERTLRHRFAHATGLSQTQIRQIERAQRAAALLRHGAPVLDVVDQLAYYDQSHLMRALKQWVGETPSALSHDAHAATK